MASETYIGVDDNARSVKDIFIGVAGKARKVTKAYIGVNGKARCCYSSSCTHSWNQIYYQSPTCYEVGFVEYECSKCGEIYTEYLGGGEHIFATNQFGVEYCVQCGLQKEELMNL